MPSFKPLNNHLLLKPDPDEYTDHDPRTVEILKRGMIILPEAYDAALKKVAMSGRLVAWGDQCRYAYAVNDHVLYGRFAGAKFGEYLIVNEESILGKIEDD